MIWISLGSWGGALYVEVKLYCLEKAHFIIGIRWYPDVYSVWSGTDSGVTGRRWLQRRRKGIFEEHYAEPVRVFANSGPGERVGSHSSVISPRRVRGTICVLRWIDRLVQKTAERSKRAAENGIRTPEFSTVPHRLRDGAQTLPGSLRRGRLRN